MNENDQNKNDYIVKDAIEDSVTDNENKIAVETDNILEIAKPISCKKILEGDNGNQGYEVSQGDSNTNLNLSTEEGLDPSKTNESVHDNLTFQDVSNDDNVTHDALKAGTTVASDISTEITRSSVEDDISDTCKADNVRGCSVEKEVSQDNDQLIANQQVDKSSLQWSEMQQDNFSTTDSSKIFEIEENESYKPSMANNDSVVGECNVRETYLNTCESENYDSSDTSALMKLAELACETNDNITSNGADIFERRKSNESYPSRSERNDQEECSLKSDSVNLENDNFNASCEENFIHNSADKSDDSNKVVASSVSSEEILTENTTLSSSLEDKTSNAPDELVIDNTANCNYENIDNNCITNAGMTNNNIVDENDTLQEELNALSANKCFGVETSNSNANITETNSENECLNIQDKPLVSDCLSIENKTSENECLNLEDRAAENDCLMEDRTMENNCLNSGDKTLENECLNLEDRDAENDCLMEDRTTENNCLNSDNKTLENECVNLEDRTAENDCLMEDRTMENNCLNSDNKTLENECLNLEDRAAENDCLIEDRTMENNCLNSGDKTLENECLNLEDRDAENDCLMEDRTTENNCLNSDNKTLENECLNLEDRDAENDCLMEDRTTENNCLNSDNKTLENECLNLEDRELVRETDFKATVEKSTSHHNVQEKDLEKSLDEDINSKGIIESSQVDNSMQSLNHDKTSKEHNSGSLEANSNDVDPECTTQIKEKDISYKNLDNEEHMKEKEIIDQNLVNQEHLECTLSRNGDASIIASQNVNTEADSVPNQEATLISKEIKRGNDFSDNMDYQQASQKSNLKENNQNYDVSKENTDILEIGVQNETVALSKETFDRNEDSSTFPTETVTGVSNSLICVPNEKSDQDLPSACSAKGKIALGDVSDSITCKAKDNETSKNDSDSRSLTTAVQERDDLKSLTRFAKEGNEELRSAPFLSNGLVTEEINSSSITKEKETSENDSRSFNCPKIYVRKDLEEVSLFSQNDDRSERQEGRVHEDVQNSNLTTVTLRRPSTKMQNVSNVTRSHVDKNEKSSKRLHTNLADTVNENSSGDNEKLVIDEERTSMTNKKKKIRKDVSQSQKKNGIDSQCVKKGSISEIISLHGVSNSSCNEPVNKVHRYLNSKLLNTKSASVEVVDLVDADTESNNGTVNEYTEVLESSRNFICDKCKYIWNDRVLKLLFEGNESVTVNSRITYGAIICMNIYVSVHYPTIKEQALIGLLDRADLAKNLGSIQVSLLNSWLVALIKNKKINCCDPFRPVYRVKTSNRSVQPMSDSNKQNTEQNKVKEHSSSSLIAEKQLQTFAKHQGSAISEIVIDDDNMETGEYSDHNTTLQINRESTKKAEELTSKIASSLASEQKGVLTNGKVMTKQFSKSNPVSYGIILKEKGSLSPDLLPFYDKLLYEPKITEEETKMGKKRFLTNKEVLCVHSVFILNAKEIQLDKYFKFFFQLLHHREYILLIPDGKTLVKLMESIRKEHNRQKFSLSKNKNFLNQSWDSESLYTAPLTKMSNKIEETEPSVRDILGAFCYWKNNKLLNIPENKPDLRDSVLSLYGNKIQIDDCFGLCIKLYANYCRLLFEQDESELVKTKMFLNLLYLPTRYLSSMNDVITFSSDLSFFPPANGDLSHALNYLEKHTANEYNQVKRSHPDSLIDYKLQQTKKLRTDILGLVKSTKVAGLMDAYARLTNEMNYLEDGENGSSLPDDSQTVFKKSFASYTSEVKLMAAKLRAANVDTENIPVILENIFHNIFKRKVPMLTTI